MSKIKIIFFIIIAFIIYKVVVVLKDYEIGHVKEGTRTALSAAGMPSGMWHHVMTYFCVAHNTEVVDGQSAYSKRHKHGQFKGKRIPFGAKVDFLPPPTLQKPLPVFAPKAVPGVFLGWHMHPGGYWSKDYLVGYVPDFEAESGIARGRRNKVRGYRVRNVLLDDNGPFVFPLKAAKTIGGKVAAAEQRAGKLKTKNYMKHVYTTNTT